jgi:hypothetical protein
MATSLPQSDELIERVLTIDRVCLVARIVDPLKKPPVRGHASWSFAATIIHTINTALRLNFISE